jgi:hypothetical protein
MNSGTRGRIRNPERAAQLRDFSALRYGNITPTDVDGLLEFSDKLYVFLEFKLGSAAMDYGQRLCFQRLCDALAIAEKIAIAIVAEHDTPIGKQIDCAQSAVRCYYMDGQWHSVGNDLTVIDMIDGLYRTFIGEVPI